MQEDRWPTANRFVGGKKHRVKNVVAVLEFVSENQPNQSTLFDWMKTHTALGTESTFYKHIKFIVNIRLLNIFDGNLNEGDAQFSVGSFGTKVLDAKDVGEPVEHPIFEALSTHVIGFDHLLNELHEGPIDIDERRYVLEGAFDLREVPDGVDQKHYVWLEALDYVEKVDGQYVLTDFGHRVSRKTSGNQRPIESRAPSELRRRSSTQQGSGNTTESTEISYVADLQTISRKTETHEQVLDTLELELDSLGFDCFETEHSDLLAVDDERVLIVEAKTVDPSSAFDQIRRAIGQLFEYEYYDVISREDWQSMQSRKCLLLDRPPGEELRRYLEHLTTKSIVVLWVDGDSIAGPSWKELREDT